MEERRQLHAEPIVNEVDGHIRAKIHEHGAYDSHLELYTAFINWSAEDPTEAIEGEEIDVVAESPKLAKEMATRELAYNYLEGGKIVKVVHRPRGFMFI